MNANPDRHQSLNTDTAPLQFDEAVRAVVDALLERRGLVRITAADSGPEILQAISDSLPRGYRYCTVASPTTPAAVWGALFEGALPEAEEPGLELREILWRRSCAGVGTVLGVTETAAIPDEVLALIEELAGMEPMLQIVMVSDSAAVRRTCEASARLAMRVRVRLNIEVTEPQRVTESAPAALSEASAEPIAGASGGPSAESSVVPAVALAAPRVAPLEAAGQRTFDPFRGHFVPQSLDSPQLLPVLSDPHGLHAEWFRVLRLRLEDWIKTHGGSPKAIAISGPEARVGKTFVAVNLALLWANSTFERVLLIDGDLRRPQFHSLFEIRQRPGLADVLARRFRPDECITFVKEVGLHVMPAGRAGNPRQLVNPDRVERVMQSLRSTYDLVILDGPPLGGMVDARSFAVACDGTLLVVRSGSTRLRSLQKAAAELPPDRLIGAVVNGAETGTESAYTRYREAVGR